MNALTVHLYLRSPLLITQLGGGDPNSGVGYHYVPGSTLRGALISRYLDGKAADAADPTFRRLFLDGSVCFLNGYPVASTGERMLPTPLSWQQPKDAKQGDPVHDWAWGKPQSEPKAWKGIDSDTFCYLTASGKAERFKPEMKINIHIAREDRQRPTSGSATIFRYDALADEQTFAGVILAEDAQDLATIRSLLPDKTLLAMGRSRSAGYGWVEVRYPRSSDGKAVMEVETDWHEIAASTEKKAQPEHLIITLLSHTLIQDAQTGAQSADLYPVLAEHPRACYTRLHKVGGFNRKWNLPMPQAEAIAAGSVFVYPYSDTLANKLTTLMEKGMGSRRAEGFGRIAVNWQDRAIIEFADAAKPRLGGSPLVSASTPLASQMVKRMLRVALDRCLIQAINENKIDRRGLRNAQLARIRVVARHALEPNNVQAAVPAKQIVRLTAFLQDLKDSARNQLQRARLGRQPLFDWLTDLANSPEGVWVTMQANVLRMPTVGNVRAELTTELAIEYTLRLIDGIAQLATREENDE